MLIPKKTKYRKCRKGRIHGRATSGDCLAFGEYGLRSLDPGRVDTKQFEAARKAISRSLKRQGKVWIRIFCHVPVTKKPADVRMGKGKGSVELWVCKVKPGMILFEISGVSKEVARVALEKGSSKISVRCRVVDKEVW